MILHPNATTKDIQKAIQDSLSIADVRGYINMELLYDFYCVFSWVYAGKSGKKALDLGSRLGKFLEQIEFERFIGDSMSYSAVLLYQKLSERVCMRSLATGAVLKGSSTINRAMAKADFLYPDLYTMYTGSELDIPREMLEFSSIFDVDIVSDVKKMTYYGQVTKVVHIEKLALPTAAYDIATKKLDIKTTEEITKSGDNELVVIQDCSLSMKNFSKELGMIKAYIMNESFKKGANVRWLYVNTVVAAKAIYCKDFPVSHDNVFTGYDFCFKDVLTLSSVQNKHVVVITDGTDSFFTIPTYINVRSVNMISINFNKELKNKILSYGRFFSLK